MPLRNQDLPITSTEQHPSAEFFRQEEFVKACENSSTPEFFRAEEFSSKTPVKDLLRKKSSHGAIPTFSSSGISLAVIATTFAVAAITIFPSGIFKGADPTFSILSREIGLDFFRGNLEIGAGEGLTYIATLKDQAGRVVTQIPVEEDGALHFQDLTMGSAYVISIADEKGVEQFTYTFETDPYVSVIPTADGTRAELILHSSIAESAYMDASFRLIDVEGKSFSDNVYNEVLTGGGDEFSSDTSGGVEVKHYLNYAGLYRNEYYLQYIRYIPEGGEEILERKIQLGNLTPLVYTLDVDRAAEQITLQYAMGDVDGYGGFSVELYQNGEYYDAAEITLQPNGDIIVPIAAEWANGEYTLYLMGVYDDRAYNQIWKGEITL